MDLNSSSDEEEAPTLHPPQLQPPPPPPPPVQAPPPALTGATRTTNSLNVDEGSETAKLAEAEEIDPLTLGVPGLKTLIPGDRVEVLWRHGAASLPMLAHSSTHQLKTHRTRARRLGERASEGVLARDAGRLACHHLSPRIRRRREGKKTAQPAARPYTLYMTC